MEEQGKVGIARFVHAHQAVPRRHPARATAGSLLSTMVYADEVNDPAAIAELDEVVDVEVSDKELAMAAPARRVARRRLRARAASRTPTARPCSSSSRRRRRARRSWRTVSQIQPDKVVDLMAALEASVAAAKEARKRHPTAHEADADTRAPAAKKARKAPAKKAAAKKAPAKKAAARRKSA